MKQLSSNIGEGTVIPLMKKPLMGRKRGNRLIRLANALFKARIIIVSGSGSKIYFGSDGGMIFQVDITQSNGGGGSGGTSSPVWL